MPHRRNQIAASQHRSADRVARRTAMPLVRWWLSAVRSDARRGGARSQGVQSPERAQGPRARASPSASGGGGSGFGTPSATSHANSAPCLGLARLVAYGVPESRIGTLLL